VIASEYVPNAGDLVWMDFTSQAGREQAERRLAVVLSQRNYNEKAGLAMLCPVTSHSKSYPFEVALPPGSGIRGVIRSDHLKSLDWRQRNLQKAGKLPSSILAEVLERICALLEIP
jgi:mRNA interferase MazF